MIALPAIAALVAREALDGRLSSAALNLSRAAPRWIVVAVTCEIASYGLYAVAQRRLLGREGRRIGIRWLASLAVCAQGVSNFVPAGYLAANVLNFRELRRRGLAAPGCARLLVTSSALYIGMLACLTLIAGEIAGGRAGGGLQGVRIGAAALLLALPVAAAVAWMLIRRGIIRLPPSWRRSAEGSRLSPSAAAMSAALFAASWAADAACLLAAIHAVGAHPQWSLVPIAYCAAQLIAFLPITPGGLGLVEGSLTVGLMAGGAGGVPVLAAVLLYRVISYWGTLPFGLCGYVAVRRMGAAGSPSLDGGCDPEAARGDRAPGGDRPLLVLEG